MSTVPHRLSVIIQRSHSLDEILKSAVEIVAEEMGLDVASIYLLDPDGARLRLRASRGLDTASIGRVTLGPGEGLTGTVVREMRPLAVADAESHPGYRYFPETREERFRSFLGVPLAIRNRPVGAIVVQSRESREFSRTETETLSTIAAQLVGVVENARLIEALDRGEIDAGYVAEVRRWRDPGHSEEIPREDIILEGTPASSGIAIGQAVLRCGLELSEADLNAPSIGAEGERARYAAALELTRAEIVEIQAAAEREADEEHALIFSSHLLLLNDAVIEKKVIAQIDAGATAHVAVATALVEFEKRLERVRDPYIRERIEDIRDLRGRIIHHLLAPGAQGPRLRERIVIAQGLPPSLVVELKAEGALGLVTESGGMTSHGALLARSMSVPAVTGIPKVSDRVRSGTLLIIDGDAGRVILQPSAKTLEEYEKRAEQKAAAEARALEFRDLPATTSDGVNVELLANIGVTADLKIARENGASGVGLYRTEFPFLVREEFPTREEQVRIYERAYEFFPDGRIYFRFLDVGGDKILRSAQIDQERDPFRGYRAIRVLLDHPQVLREQTQAFALAAAGRPLSLLVPMISRLDELHRVRDLIREALDSLDETRNVSPKLGIMVELPATVEIAHALARDADFLSVGTNDLIQYALGVDREEPRVATRLDAYHPAILRMVHRTVVAAHEACKPVSICGEIANDPKLALALVAVGVDSLSLSPSSLPRLKRDLSSGNASQLRLRLDEILTAGTANEVEETIAACFDKV